MKKSIWNILWLLSFMGFGGCANTTAGELSKPAQRPTQWAVPVEKSEVPNLFRVEQKLYRSAQPKPGDFEKLYAMGIRYSLNLQYFRSDQLEIGKVSIREYRIPIFITSMDYHHLVEAVRYIVRSDAPVLVHCMFGSDRSGTVVAAYRIAVQGWSKEKAIEEMIEGGYGYHTIFGNLPKLLRALDVLQFRQDIYRNPESA